ncbi:AAA family ATPase [Campylobacter coli]|nr:AAA family ATPase [Campylobacter coli]
MIHKLHIKNFKLIKDNSFDFKPLTIITGTNSCGKSSILQTLCFFINTNILNIEKSMYIQNFTRNLYIFDQMRNKDLHEDSIHITLNEKNIINITKEEITKNTEYLFDFEENFYYLKSNRNLIQDTEKIQNNIKFGVSGEYIGNYFSTNSLKSIDEIFYENPDSNKILNYHVDKWIKEILDLEISFTTNESIDIILNGFKDKNFSNYFLPSNISTGLNFATKIIIIGLSLKKGDIFIIENPEIHFCIQKLSLNLQISLHFWFQKEFKLSSKLILIIF